jgi:transposase
MRTRRQFTAQFTAQFKADRVMEVLGGRGGAADVCREHHVKPDLLSRWKAEFVAHAAGVFRGDERSQQAERRIAELGRMVGRPTVELGVAKKAARLSVGTRGGW